MTLLERVTASKVPPPPRVPEWVRRAEDKRLPVRAEGGTR